MNGSIFQFLASLFKKHRVRPVLVGGYAVIAYKVQRMTFDIDFIMTAEECARLEDDVVHAGYEVFNRSNAFVQFKSGAQGMRDLDFLLSDEHTIERLVAQGRKINIAGETFIVPSIPHLLSMKLHAIAENKQREIKDLPDVAQLLAASQSDPSRDEIKQLFEKFNLMELYERIIASAASTIR